MSEIVKGAKVKVTNILGITEDSAEGHNFIVIGKEGYVHSVQGEWVNVIIPEHRFYSLGMGCLLKLNEVELVV